MNTNIEPRTRMDQLLGQAMTHDVPPAVRARMRRRLDDFHARLESDTAAPKWWWWMAALPLWAKAVPAAAAVVCVALVAGHAVMNDGHPDVSASAAITALREARSAAFILITRVGDMPPMSLQAMILEPDKMRIDLPEQGMTNIFDQKRREMLILMDRQKQATLIKLEGEEEENAGSPKGLLEHLRQLKDQAEETLPEKEIGERMARGFRLSKDAMTTTLWLDSENGEILRVEMEQSFPVPASYVMEEFALDVELEESLFSMTPPSDYTVTTTTMNVSKPVEGDLVECFRALTERSQGHFPDGFTVMELAGSLEKYQAPGDKTLEQNSAEGMALGLKFGRGFAFVQQLKPAQEWRYLGQGVTLGEADKPVCWWRPDTGAATFRVIYGDLGLRDVPETELPEIPEPTPVQAFQAPAWLEADEHIRPATSFGASGYYFNDPLGTFHTSTTVNRLLFSHAYDVGADSIVLRGKVPSGLYDIVLKVPPDPPEMTSERIRERLRKCLDDAFGCAVTHKGNELIVQFPDAE